MKTLFLLRHAKSSWKYPELKDFERPLSVRGLAEVPIMAERFKARGKVLECIITSPAVRAKTTAGLFAEVIGFPKDDVASNPELYFAGAGMFLKAANLLDEEYQSAMLVGHNPAITEFVNRLSNSSIDNIYTCGLVELSLPVDEWSEVEFGKASLVDFDYPRRRS
jgi:phosphohistidine phosphatase